MKNRLLFLTLLVILLTFLIGAASATQPTSGSCGPDLQWNLDKATGVLTIFFVCPYGGTVLDWLREKGYPVYVTWYN